MRVCERRDPFAAVLGDGRGIGLSEHDMRTGSPTAALACKRASERLTSDNDYTEALELLHIGFASEPAARLLEETVQHAVTQALLAEIGVAFSLTSTLERASGTFLSFGRDYSEVRAPVENWVRDELADLFGKGEALTVEQLTTTAARAARAGVAAQLVIRFQSHGLAGVQALIGDSNSRSLGKSVVRKYGKLPRLELERLRVELIDTRALTTALDYWASKTTQLNPVLDMQIQVYAMLRWSLDGDGCIPLPPREPVFAQA